MLQQRKPTMTVARNRAMALDRAEEILDRADSENRAVTDSEERDIKAAMDEIDGYDRMMLREKLNHTSGRPAHNEPLFPADNPAASAPRMPHGKLRAFASAEDAYRSGRWLQAQLLGDPQAARWCKDAGMPLMASGEGINTAGGAVVPSELATSIISLMDTFGVARQECRIVGMGSDSISIPRRTSGLTPYFVGENVELTESDAAWDNVQLTAKKLAVLTRMSSEISEDAIIDLAEWLSQEIARAFAEREDQCLFNGDGSVTYGGMEGLTVKLINGDHGAGAVAAASGHDTVAEVDADDLINLMAAAPQYALRNAKWYVSPVSWALILEAIAIAGGGNSATDIANGAPKRFMGYPVVISPALPTSTGTLNGEVMLLFGDMQAAVAMGDRRQIRLMVSEHRYYELDQVGVRGTERFHIVAHDLGDGTTAGPLVGLVGTT